MTELTKVGPQVVADARAIVSENGGQITVEDVGRLAVKYGLNFKATCEWLEESRVLKVGTYGRLKRCGIKFGKTLEAIRNRVRCERSKTVSKPLDQMTKDELIYALGDILERETDDWSKCRWCGAEEKPVNLAGEEVSPEEADEYQIEHEADCAVTYIEAVLAGTYVYVDEPGQALAGPRPELCPEVLEGC